jgi:cation diffusion facilitator CzcD-associated flavoprotein CzcO
VAEERGIRPHIRFGTDVARAEYDDGEWRLTTADGKETFDVLIAATGVLRVSRYPEIAGLETFAGPAFHSSHWDHSISLPDKRIGLIGTGSTGVQIVAELGGKVHGLKVFQRTAQWVCPVPNLRYSALTRAALRRWPRLNELSYRFWGRYLRTMFGSAPIRPGFPHKWFTFLCWWNLRLSVRDPQLRAKLTPKDLPMCKRLIFAGHYYRSVRQPGVEVITDPIDHIEPAA